MADVEVAVLERRQEDDTIKRCVAELCRKYPSVKGDYWQLCWRFWREYCGVKISFATFEAMRFAPSPETIGRRMRELKVENPFEYAATAPTEHKRWKRFRVMLEHYSGARKLNEFWGEPNV